MYGGRAYKRKRAIVLKAFYFVWKWMDCYCFFFIHIYPQKLSGLLLLSCSLRGIAPAYFLIASLLLLFLPFIFFLFHLFFHAALVFLTFMSVCFLFLSRLPKWIAYVCAATAEAKKLPRIPWRKKICLLSFMQFSCSGKVHYRKLWLVIWVPFRMTLHAETDCELSAAVYGKERKVSKKNRHYHHHHYCRHPSSHYGDRSTTDYYKYVWMRAEAGW